MWGLPSCLHATVSFCHAEAKHGRVATCKATLTADAASLCGSAASARAGYTCRAFSVPGLTCLATQGALIITGTASGEITMWRSSSPAESAGGDWQLQPVRALQFEEASVTSVHIHSRPGDAWRGVAILSSGCVAAFDLPGT